MTDVRDRRQRVGHRLVCAEWTKLRTARSTGWMPIVATVSMAVLTAAVTAAAAPNSVSCATGCDPTKLTLSGVHLGQIAVVVLGVLAMSAEHATSLISSTLAAAPSRIRVLAAKAAVVAATAFTVGLVAVPLMLLTGQRFLTRNGFPSLSLTNGPTARAAFGTVLYLVLLALLSLGVATALRDAARSIATMLGLLYLLPLLAQIVPGETWRSSIEKLAPMRAGLAIQATTDLQGLPVAPWTGLGVLAVYALTSLAVGALLLARRDV